MNWKEYLSDRRRYIRLLSAMEAYFEQDVTAQALLDELVCATDAREARVLEATLQFYVRETMRALFR